MEFKIMVGNERKFTILYFITFAVICIARQKESRLKSNITIAIKQPFCNKYKRTRENLSLPVLKICL